MHNYCIVVTMENEKCFMFSGEAMAWADVGHFLPVCKDAKEVVYHPKNRGGEAARGCARGMGKKRSKTTNAIRLQVLQRLMMRMVASSVKISESDDVIRSRDCFLEIDSVYEAVAGIQPVLGWIRSVLVQLWIWFRMNETGDLSFLSKKHNFDK
jgi:hypothetical protein